MTKSELRTSIRNLFLENFDNVESRMYHPVEYAELNNDFPYITIVFNKWTPQQISKYGTQEISIIGIVSGDDETLMAKLDDMQTKIIDSIYKKDVKMNVTLIDNNNLFAPFGLDAGVFYPYAGVRIECTVANVISWCNKN